MRKIPKSAWQGIKLAIAGFLLLGVIGMAVYSDKAKSAEWFSDKPIVFLGVDHVTNNVFCERKLESGLRQNNPKDPWVSNLGILIPIVDFSNYRLSGNWTHHSCALGYDAPTYDGTGLRLEWRF